MRKGISPEQFAHAIESIFTGKTAETQMPTKKICIAVSGGVDSMALTFLSCQYFIPRGIKVTGLTVNHNLREGSSLEANDVGRLVKGLGASSRVLTIQWPHGVNPERLEIDARNSRLNLLRKASSFREVHHLFFAHTLDDQLETMLFRLASGSTIRGLAGMHPLSKYWMAPAPNEKPLQFVRPLLGFSKQQLYDTCIENGVKWFEDPSNQDPHLTVRNSIRYMLSDESKLPRAFHRDQLLETFQTFQAKRDDVEREAKEIYDLITWWNSKQENQPVGDRPRLAGQHYFKIDERKGIVYFQEFDGFQYLRKSVIALLLSRLVGRIWPSAESSRNGYEFSPFYKIAERMKNPNMLQFRDDKRSKILSQFEKGGGSTTIGTAAGDIYEEERKGKKAGNYDSKKILLDSFTERHLLWQLWGIPVFLKSRELEENLNSLASNMEDVEDVEGMISTEMIYLWQVQRQPVYVNRGRRQQIKQQPQQEEEEEEENENEWEDEMDTGDEYKGEEMSEVSVPKQGGRTNGGSSSEIVESVFNLVVDAAPSSLKGSKTNAGRVFEGDWKLFDNRYWIKIRYIPSAPLSSAPSTSTPPLSSSSQLQLQSKSVLRPKSETATVLAENQKQQQQSTRFRLKRKLHVEIRYPIFKRNMINDYRSLIVTTEDINNKKGNKNNNYNNETQTTSNSLLSSSKPILNFLKSLIGVNGDSSSKRNINTRYKEQEQEQDQGQQQINNNKPDWINKTEEVLSDTYVKSLTALELQIQPCVYIKQRYHDETDTETEKEIILGFPMLTKDGILKISLNSQDFFLPTSNKKKKNQKGGQKSRNNNNKRNNLEEEEQEEQEKGILEIECRLK